MKDLTVLFYTANHTSDYFFKNVTDQLVRAIGDTPLISISHKPLNFGKNICVGVMERCAYSIYKQVLIGAKAAETEYVATAEDDVLYPPEHFTYRPQGDTFAYDVNKWSIFTWTRPPLLSYRERRTMTSLIVRREALVKTLEERFAAWPDRTKIMPHYFGEPGRFEVHLGITPVANERFKAAVPSIVFSHTEAVAFSEYLGKRKAHSKIRATEVAPWGRASDLLKLYDKSYV